MERYAISRTTVWRLRRSGALQSVNIGRAVRYRAADVAALLEDGGVEVQK